MDLSTEERKNTLKIPSCDEEKSLATERSTDIKKSIATEQQEPSNMPSNPSSKTVIPIDQRKWNDIVGWRVSMTKVSRHHGFCPEDERAIDWNSLPTLRRDFGREDAGSLSNSQWWIFHIDEVPIKVSQED